MFTGEDATCPALVARDARWPAASGRTRRLLRRTIAPRAMPGIGDWTAQRIAMRALAWPDAFPATDIGLLNALGTRDVAAAMQASEAWRACAAIRLWHSLENPT